MVCWDDIAGPKPDLGVFALPSEARCDCLPCRIVEVHCLAAGDIRLMELPLIQRLRDDLCRRESRKPVGQRIGLNTRHGRKGGH